ncbi:MAG: hypothetical protein GX620_10650 [Chloroflexi bacterium]|nr:hypothetical protein [Chloroflexota bacterium]
MDYLLSIDAGTTSVKVVVFDELGRVVAGSLHEYQLLTPHPDWVELGPDVYWLSAVAGIADVVGQLGDEAQSIRAVGVTSQGETLIPVDATGRPLRRAIVWLDNRAVDEAQIIASAFDAGRFYEVTGLPEIIPSWPACRMLWLAENEPDVFAQVGKYLLVEDYLIYRLTGRTVTEPGVCTSTGYLDIAGSAGDGRTWWPEMLDFVGVSPTQLPELVGTGEVVGQLTRAAAEELGLSRDVVVVTGGMDQIAAAVGAGNLAPGIVSETTGTALVIVSTVDQPTYDSQKRFPLYCHALPDRYLLEPYCQTAGMVLRWYRDLFGGGRGYDELTALAADAPPGCDRLLMLPYLTGATSPHFDPDARGVFHGIGLQHSQGHFVRAILEAVAFELRENVEVLQDMGVAVESVISLGGGARSDLWLQIKADVLGLPVQPAECEETTSLGVAIMSAVAVGLHPDLPTACRHMVRTRPVIEPAPGYGPVYDAAFARYRAVYAALEGTFGC